MIRTLLIASTLLWAGAASAEEVIIERAAPPPASSKTTVEKHGADCDSKTVHKEDDTGASSTVTREDCD